MKVLNKILSSVLAFMVAAMVVVCCWQVITRFVLGNPSKYTEEILRFALIWLTMLGAPYAYGAKQHLAIDLLVKSFEPTGQISAAMKLPMECYYACIPIGGALMILYSLNNLYHLFRDKDKEVA